MRSRSFQCAGLGCLLLAIALAASCGADDNGPAQTTGEVTYYKDIQPIYAKYCSDCHWGSAADNCQGKSCFANHYDGLLFTCDTFGREEMNKAECGLFRIDETNKLGRGTDPGDEDIVLLTNTGEILFVPTEDAELIRGWIEAGMPAGSSPKEPLVRPEDSPPNHCEPQCDNVECGEPDGCGGVCCDDSPCVPDCAEKSCGSDGCGGSCPDTCRGACDEDTGACQPERG